MNEYFRSLAVPAAAATPVGKTRVAAAVELSGLVTGVLAIMWVAPFLPDREFASRAITGFLLLLLAISRWRDDETWAGLGFRFDNFWPVLKGLLPFVAGLVVFVVSVGAVAGSLRFGERFWRMLVGVPLWGLLQHYLLLAFAHRKFRVLVGDGHRSVFATAALFGVVHLPNPALTIVCTLGGFVWANAYDRSPNLFAHAVTHAIGSAFVANTLPDTWLKSMVVGYRYLLL